MSTIPSNTHYCLRYYSKSHSYIVSTVSNNRRSIGLKNVTLRAVNYYPEMTKLKCGMCFGVDRMLNDMHKVDNYSSQVLNGSRTVLSADSELLA